MFQKEKIGIIGLGYVGNAIKHSFLDHIDVEIVEIDLDPSKGCTGTYQDLENASGVFICVSSPSNSDGSCNVTPLTNVLSNLKDFKGVIISKVTAPPDVYESFQSQYPNLVHSPEFLTAANAIQDYLGGKFAIIGGSVKAYMNEAQRLIRLSQQQLEITHFCTIGEASLAKYIINSFLATKVVFMNEMAELAKIGGQDWHRIRQLIALDGRRIGISHTQVPGPDGAYGFGGACFPKDTEALLKYAESKNVQVNVLDSAVKKNLMIRLTNPK